MFRLAVVSAMVAGLLLSGCTRQYGQTEALDDGWSMLVAEDYASAQAHYQSMLAEDPNNAVANLNLGVAYEELGDNAKAAKHYQIAIANGKDALLQAVAHEGSVAPRSTTVAIVRSCSGCESVGDSPVVPTGHRQVVPASIWNSTCCLRTSTSTCPSRNGVVMATDEPANCSHLVAMGSVFPSVCSLD